MIPRQWGRYMVLLLILPGLIFAKGQGRELKGQVLLVGRHNETTPAVGIDIILKERGDSVRTKAGGLFRLFLPDVFKAGETVTLLVNKSGWRVQYPLDGEIRIPADLDKDQVELRLLPVGSKRFWTEDRIEKFIQDTAEKAKQQVTPEGRPEDIDFSRYIKDWAAQYGFSAVEAKVEIDKWIAEVQQRQDDSHKLGLAAYAEKNFGKASELFTESAETKAKRLEELTREMETLTEETVRDFRLAGDAAYNNYAFRKALHKYQRALDYIAKGKRPRLWAAVVTEIGTANWQIGIRAAGADVHNYLNAAVSAYRNALTVYTRAQLPQQWAMTQNNLGNALSDQGIRTGGEQGRQLLAEAVSAFRNALTVRTRELLPQQWAVTQNNLGIALRALGEQENSIERLEEAKTAIQSVYTMYKESGDSQYDEYFEEQLRALEDILQNFGK